MNFNQEITFILGAGSSHPYGYPLGVELIEKIIKAINSESVYFPRQNQDSEKESYNLDYFRKALNKSAELLDLKDDAKTQKPMTSRNGHRTVRPHIDIYYTHECLSELEFLKVALRQITEFRELSEALKISHPVSIDAFVNQNKKYEETAKWMICYILLKDENEDVLGRHENGDNSDKWYSYLINDLLLGCAAQPKDLLNNKLNIITFNYDISLDYFLYRTLVENYDIANSGFGQKFWEHLNCDELPRLIHVYGTIHDDISKYGRLKTNTALQFLFAYKNRNRIKLMFDERKKEIKPKIDKILNRSKLINIIGFSFDRANLDMLGFPKKTSTYKKFLENKTINYLDYRGAMRSLHNQFLKLEKKCPGLKINRSDADSIVHAYSNDFKIWLAEDL